MMKKFRRRNQEVEALLYDGSNADQFGDVTVFEGYIIVHTDYGDLRLDKDHYLVKDCNSFYAKHMNVFEDMYEKVIDGASDVWVLIPNPEDGCVINYVSNLIRPMFCIGDDMYVQVDGGKICLKFQMGGLGVYSCGVCTEESIPAGTRIWFVDFRKMLLDVAQRTGNMSVFENSPDAAQ